MKKTYTPMRTDDIITVSTVGLASLTGIVVAQHGDFRDASIEWAFKLATLVLAAVTVVQLVRYYVMQKKPDGLLSSALILVGATVAVIALDRAVTFDFPVFAKRREVLGQARPLGVVRDPITGLQSPRLPTRAPLPLAAAAAEPGIDVTIVETDVPTLQDALHAYGQLEETRKNFSDMTARDSRFDVDKAIAKLNAEGRRRPSRGGIMAIQSFLPKEKLVL